MKPHSKNTHRSARLGIPLTQPQMAAYLTGAVGTAAMLSAPQAEAAVTAVNFGFGPQYTAADGTSNWSVGPGFGTLRGAASNFNVSLGRQDNQGLGFVYHTGSYDQTYGLPTFFANNTVIGNSLNGNRGYAYFQDNVRGTLDFTSNQLNKNIAFKTSTNNWGWANVSWTESSKTLAIHSAYIESVANTAITVGDVGAVPEPSRALLALAGLGGVALRRRRKQAV